MEIDIAREQKRPPVDETFEASLIVVHNVCIHIGSWYQLSTYLSMGIYFIFGVISITIDLNLNDTYQSKSKAFNIVLFLDTQQYF